MQLNQSFAWGVVAMLVAVSPPLTFFRTAYASPEQLAQITPNTVTDQLDENSEILEDGSYSDVHTFEGKAEEAIRIDLISEDFDTYLILTGSDGIPIAQDDDTGVFTNAQIAISLPATDTYQIWAKSFNAKANGQYTLIQQTATDDEIAQHQNIQQANRLNHEAINLYWQGLYAEGIPLAE
jgi:hypothetical protein